MFHKKQATLEEMVGAIRQDPEVGLGSCSVIDECFTDDELKQRLVKNHISSVSTALTVTREISRVYNDVMMDQYHGAKNSGF